jgi:2-succinyl-6-hydroxy-2,4-cyclohexadiene-1-carboxylate synthase
MVDGLRWEVRTRGDGRPLLLLHGFTGRGSSWAGQRRALARDHRVIVVDLPGHGRSGLAAPERMSVERSADDLAAILTGGGWSPAGVLGYSLGARIALRLAVAHPSTVERLILESPSAGLEHEGEREARRAADAVLADRIERTGVGAFVTQWEQSAVFASHAALPAARARRQQDIRLGNRAAGLAASLRGAGQGSMEPLFDRLASIAARTLVIAGELDRIGRPRAERVAAGIPRARLAVVEGAGHAPHVERPAVFHRLILDFLQEVPAA